MTTITLYIGLILTQAFLGASRLAVRPTIHMIRRMEIQPFAVALGVQMSREHPV
jgi:di/tricarboxylate transporter